MTWSIQAISTGFFSGLFSDVHVNYAGLVTGFWAGKTFARQQALCLSKCVIFIVSKVV